MSTSASAIVRRRACLIAILIAVVPAAARSQEPANKNGDARARVRRFLDPASWLRPRLARTKQEPALRPAMQEAAAPDASTPAVVQPVAEAPPTASSPSPAVVSPEPAAPSSGAPAGEAAPASPTPSSESAEAVSMPRIPNLGELGANRAVGGDQPSAEAVRNSQTAAGEDDAQSPIHIQDLLGGEDSPIQIHGWIQNSYTGNANGRGASGQNLGVWPNHKADWWMGNQYYIVVQKPLKMDDTLNFGFRVDNMFGHDWQWNYMQGLFNDAFPLNHFGYDIPQLYGSIHLPILTEGGLDVKGGRFYTLAGYEQVLAVGRPLLSTPYMFTFGQPFTHFGVQTVLHLTDRINVYNGALNGWDRWVNIRYAWGYVGGFSWTGEDARNTLTLTTLWGVDQFPDFLPANQQMYPTGYVNVPSLAGRYNPGYWRNGRTLFTWVGTHKWSDKLTQVVESDQGWERAIPGLGSGGRNAAPRDAGWFSFGNWFLYDVTPKLTAVWRSEIFWDVQGARVQNMVNGQFVGDRYHEITLGAIYKPHPNLWVRPEARYDWTQYHSFYTDGTRKSQFTIAFDAIVIW